MTITRLAAYATGSKTWISEISAATGIAIRTIASAAGDATAGHKTGADRAERLSQHEPRDVSCWRRSPCARQSPWPAARPTYDSTLNRAPDRQHERDSSQYCYQKALRSVYVCTPSNVRSVMMLSAGSIA